MRRKKEERREVKEKPKRERKREREKRKFLFNDKRERSVIKKIFFFFSFKL